ncbi:MAG: hypothetical protein ACLUVA_09105 [Faecalibacterium sp.]
MGNLSLSMQSMEGSENTNDARRGDGCFDRVMEAMDLSESARHSDFRHFHLLYQK